MPEFTSYDAGTPSWVDHATKDLRASTSFYGSLFGWDPDDQGEDMGHYTIMRKVGRSTAGDMQPMGEGQPSAWTSYVSVADADATIEVVKKAGGTVFVGPMDVADIGRMAVFADPEGAVIGVWQPKSFIGAEVANEPGSFVWNELNTRDVPGAEAFYSEVFGWKAKGLDMEAMPYTEFQLGERTIAGMIPMPDMVPFDVPAHWLVYFGVDDTDATAAKATELGATTVVAPTDIPPGRFAILADPDGAVFAIIKMEVATS
jgi:predicted enzyme related to lactoylglutathione lyase